MHLLSSDSLLFWKFHRWVAGGCVWLVLLSARAVAQTSFSPVATPSVANSQQSAALPSLDFERDIFPIVKHRCLDCHAGADAEAALDLSSMTGALKGGDSGEPTIVPGSSAASHLIERITSDNVSLRMPPDDERLPDLEIDALRRWIDAAEAWEGAAAELASAAPSHWAFEPLGAIQLLSENALPTDGSHPIDSLVRERLARDDLQMSVAADRARLIRRLYLVMHGLLPTHAEVESFVNDDAPQAWARLVDSVLESPRYGERLASYWLDLARYGDTTGFETNRERPTAYHYRDWVVEAFNADLPYDQFVMAQIAGDATGHPRATGFLVAGPNDIVKGQDALLGLMQRQDELTDMVSAVGATFLGLTTGCARCHNHKFDPISQSDFYAMQAVFAGVEHGDRPLPISDCQQTEIAVVADRLKDLRQSLAEWQVQAELRPAVVAKENNEQFSPVAAKFLRFDVQATNGGEPCIDELVVLASKSAVLRDVASGEADSSEDHNVALASSGTIATSSGDFEHPFHKLMHINDGKFGNERSWIASKVADGWVQLEFPKIVTIDRVVWGRDRQGVYADRLPVQYSISVSPDGQQWTEVASSSDRTPVGVPPERAIRYRFDSVAAESKRSQLIELAAKAEQLQAELEELQQTESAYTGQFTTPSRIHRLFRGDPLAPREEIAPGAIKVLGELTLPAEATDQQRRLALAEWIVRDAQSLTARVMANRLWQFHFGNGLVDTPSDLGQNGAEPTHPALLDWLAKQLIEGKWSIKQLHRTILLSDTWQQDSRPRPDGIAKDAASRLLWRYPPHRLDAEAIRDNMLWASGTLDLTMGGPSFSPFEISMENVRHYFPKEQYGPADWRRMLYMQKVRQEREGTFGVFDCPDATQAVPKRGRSTTPLQALNLLNSEFVLQQAELLAERLKREHESLPKQIENAYRLCFGREPDADERSIAEGFIREHGLRSFTRAMLNANEFLFVP